MFSKHDGFVPGERERFSDREFSYRTRFFNTDSRRGFVYIIFVD